MKSRSNRKRTKPAVKSKRKQAKLGYGQTNKNINTLRKLEQAAQEELLTTINKLDLENSKN